MERVCAHLLRRLQHWLAWHQGLSWALTVPDSLASAHSTAEGRLPPAAAVPHSIAHCLHTGT